MAAEPPGAGASGGVVLVVDDDDFVRGTVQRQLERLGLRSVAATGGTEGLELLRAHPPFDTIICDLRMPGMDGIEFLRHVAAARPGARVLLASAQDPKILGLAGELVTAHGLQLLAVLHKPVVFDDLRRVMAGREVAPAASRLPGAAITAGQLRVAIEREEIQAFVQPKVHAGSGALAGVEALARWLPEGGPPVLPDQFIPLAEKAGLIDSLTDLMLRQALRSCGEWSQAGRPMTIAINVAPVTLHHLDLPDTILRLAAGFGVLPGQVVVEVTESGVLGNEALALDVLTRLRLRGIALSIDDFGTGFSSLKQLQRLPFTELKIDRSFVSSMIVDADAARIVESNIQLARDLGVVSTAAEGVETGAQLAQLARLGCTYAQGYFIARPMPRAQLLDWVARSGR